MITLSNISKVFGKGEAKTVALHDLSLEIREGELLAVMGPSGSGKSTLLNILGCLDKPTTGEYLLRGEAVGRCSGKELARLRNERFGFVVQDFALVERYTAEKNIRIPLSYSRKKKDAAAAVNQVLQELSITGLRRQLCCTMSGGQRQRVAIARALVNDPDILLADEPTGALDSKTGGEILEVFHRVHEEGRTVIIVTHDERVARQCQRTIHLVDGTLVEK